MSQPAQFASRVVPSKLATLNRLRKFSRLLDSAIGIPGTKFRFGLDPILGLIPGGGDFLGTILSAYLVIEAARLGLPKETLVKMVSNIVLESAVGTVPVIGDLFDAAWKANTKNFELVEAHLNIQDPRLKENRWGGADEMTGAGAVGASCTTQSRCTLIYDSADQRAKASRSQQS